MLPRGERAGRSASEIAGRNPSAAPGQSACCSQCINPKRIIIILQPCSTLDFLHCFATPISAGSAAIARHGHLFAALMYLCLSLDEQFHVVGCSDIYWPARQEVTQAYTLHLRLSGPFGPPYACSALQLPRDPLLRSQLPEPTRVKGLS
jgi:hypothetical protein